MPLRIHNARVGFATNSSSSHSIILLKKGGKVADHDVASQDFGWDYFTCATPQAKLAYLAMQVFQTLRSEVGEDAAFYLAQAFTGGRLIPQEGSTREAPQGHVDHQSQISGFPKNWNGVGLDRDFLDDLRQWFLREDVAILGGNDNGGDDHPDKDEGTPTGLFFSRPEQYSTRARKDPKTGVWTLFNAETGTKLRFSFNDPASEALLRKAHAPELVDLKITDFCTAGCAFCYQGSTPKGEHAPLRTLRRIIQVLGELRVFEVALGGGEPTQHPDFLDILDECRQAGIVPNFTTKQVDWMRDPQVVKRVNASVGAFAVSVEGGYDVDAAMAAFANSGLDHDKLSVQFVLGVDSGLWDLRHVLRKAYAYEVPVTLLGFKKVGRGEMFQYQGYGDWLKEVTAMRDNGISPQIGIDTALAAQTTEELGEVGISPRLYEVHEGKFSMYIDAVTNKVGPSSYDPAKLESFTFDDYGHHNAPKLLKLFAKW